MKPSKLLYIFQFIPSRPDICLDSMTNNQMQQKKACVSCRVWKRENAANKYRLTHSGGEEREGEDEEERVKSEVRTESEG